VVFVPAFLFGLALSLVSSTTAAVEKAYLDNDAALFYELLTPEGSINISLPEPIAFSDQLSRQQAYFFFRQIFATFETLEFAPEGKVSSLAGKSLWIFTARWSFKNMKTNARHTVRVFYLMMPGGPGKPKRPGGNPWKIAEIRAEKLWTKS
jgi:hypothetical protein